MSNSVRFKAKNGLDNNSNTIINVADPVNAQDAATKNYVTTSISGFSSGGYAGTIGISAATTLDATYANKFIEASGSSSFTINLPLGTVYTKDGTQLTFLVAYGSQPITLSTVATGSAYIFNGTQGTSQTLVLNAGDSVVLTTTASNINYIVIGGSAALPYTTVMAGANWTTPSTGDNSTKLATTAFVQNTLETYHKWTFETTSFTAVSNTNYAINATASVTITLPASPSNGDVIRLLDFGQNFGSYNASLAGNGNNVEKSSTSLTLDVSGISIELSFMTGQGWIITDTGNVINGAGSYAPIYSPSFTGTPLAPTPSQFDNTTKIATTAFVQTSQGNYQNVVSVSGTTTLTTAQLGSAIKLSGSSTYTVTLPTPVGYTGKAFSIWSVASVGITLSSPAGVINTAAGSGTATYVLPANSSAELIADGANWVVAFGSSATPTILPVTASVASNALTVGLNSTTLSFRNTTVGSLPVTVTNPSALSLTVPSTATLGTVSAVAARLVLLALNNAGTIALGIVNIAGGTVLDESGLVSTTAISTGATSSSVIYSTAALTNVAYRVIGYIDITEATAGTWATAPTNIQGSGLQVVASMGSIGYGQTWQSVTGSRVYNTTYYNTTGKPIFISVTLSSTTAATAQLNINGIVTAGSSYSSSGGGISVWGIIPPGASYFAYVNSGTGSIIAWNELR